MNKEHTLTLSKLIEKTKNLGPTIEKTFNNDLEKILEMMCLEFDIYYRGTDNRIDKHSLFEKFCFKHVDDPNIYANFCSAIKASGTPCTNKKYQNSKYCKKHMSKEWMEKYSTRFSNETEKSPRIFFEEQNIIYETADQINATKIDISKLSKKFIEDSFYYIDSKFIYDANDYRKVGYVDNNEYILTDDPFILSNL